MATSEPPLPTHDALNMPSQAGADRYRVLAGRGGRCGQSMLKRNPSLSGIDRGFSKMTLSPSSVRLA